MSHLLFHLLLVFHHSRCDPALWVNVMPERLLSVISGILAGGIPGFRIELCCFHHPLTWPLCVIPCFLCFASCSVAILNDTQDVIMHVIPIAGSDPTSLCFLFVLVWLWLCVFGWFLLFLVVVFWFLLGQLAGLCTGPLPVLLWLSTS